MDSDRTFIAIDVETGDTLRHVVGVAIAEFREPDLDARDAWQSRVDPDTEFSRALRLIDDVTGRGLRRIRNFAAIHPILAEWLDGRVVVTHGDHARRALDAACDRYTLARFVCRWVDSHALAKAALERRREEQYRLESLAAWLGVELPRNNAVRRAQVAGQAALWCAAILGSSVNDLAATGTSDDAARPSDSDDGPDGDPQAPPQGSAHVRAGAESDGFSLP